MNSYGEMGVSAGLGIITGGINSAINNAFAQKQAELNYYYNELAAQNADRRTRALYRDLYSVNAQLNQIKEAGLSPSLMYGGAGGTQGTTGAQGGGTAGIAPPYGNYMQIADALALARTKAEIENINADTELKRGENPRGEAEVQGILAEAGLKQAETKYTQSKTALTDLETYVADQTKEFNVRQARATAEKCEWDSWDSFWTARKKRLDFEFSAETFEDRTKEIRAKVANILKDSLLKDEQIKCTREQAELFATEAQKAYSEIGIRALEWSTQNNYIEHENEYIDKLRDTVDEQIKIALKNSDIAGTRMWLEFAGSIIRGAENIGAMYMLKGKGGAGRTIPRGETTPMPNTTYLDF